MGHKPDQRARRKRREARMAIRPPKPPPFSAQEVFERKSELAAKSRKRRKTKPDQVDVWLVQALEQVEAACDRRERRVDVTLCEIDPSAAADDPQVKAAEETATCLRADDALRVSVRRTNARSRTRPHKLVLRISW